MQRRIFLRRTMIGAGIAISPNLLFAEAKRALPNVLLLGDSVSMGYGYYKQNSSDGHQLEPWTWNWVWAKLKMMLLQL